ncbi:MAG: hypothetical protein ACOY0T_28350 [Myxococcota bacterium]
MAKTCKRCLLNGLVEGVILDQQDVCNHCRRWEVRREGLRERMREAMRADLERALRYPDRSGEYDCIVSFSGGKDSCYLLHKLVKDYELRVLAYTSDFDIPPNTWDNIRRTVGALRVDHHVEKPSPDLYRRFIRHLLQHQGPRGAVHTVCYFWLDIREGDLLRLAVSKNVPLILTGYSPGQPDPKRMLYEMPPSRISSEDWTPRELFECNLFQESEKSLFWNPNLYPAGTRFPRILAPFHAWDYNQEEVMQRVVELGLVKNRWYANPVLSNFTLNWLLMHSDLENFGYNPYLPEFAQLVREGKAKRWVWKNAFILMNLMIQKRVLLGRNVDRSLAWLDLKPEDLRVRPAHVTSPTLATVVQGSTRDNRRPF